MFVERCAQVGTTELAECPICTKPMQNKQYEYTVALQKQKIWGSFNTPAKCPGKCCDAADGDCRKSLDNTGYPAVADDEFLLIFGGLTWRNKSYVDDEYGHNVTLYDNCERYVAQVTAKNQEIDDILKACGEQISNEIWKFSLRRREWYYVKVTYNEEISPTQIIYAPFGRYGHAGVYVELDDAEAVLNAKELKEDPTIDAITVMRKYLYTYGGFSNECTTACFDTWRYEIAYAPYAYYPAISIYEKPGNYWEQ